MLSTLIRKELLNNLLNLRFIICYCAILFIVVLSVVNMGIKYQDAYADALKNRNQFEEKIRACESPRESSTIQIQTIPERTSIFRAGFSKTMYAPFYASVQFTEGRGIINNADPIYLQYRVYDLGFIIAVIISLLAILLNFDSFSGERESHTIQLVLSHPVPRSTILLGKLLGGYVTVILPLAIAWLLSLVILTVMGVAFSGPDLVRILIMAGLTVAYLAVVFLITILCSIVSPNSVISLLGSVIAWVVLVFLLPWGLFTLGQLTNPGISESELIRVNETILEERNMICKRKQGKMKDRLKISLMWAKASPLTVKAQHEYRQKARRALYRQIRTGMAFSRVSPAACFLHAFSTATGTGFTNLLHYDKWKNDLIYAHYHTQLSTFNERLFKAGGETYWKRLEATRAQGPVPLDQYPDRVYPVLDLSRTFGAIIPDLLILLLETTGLFLLAFYAFIHRKNFL